jgi:radical SAM protein with 4Fe4S-binding SPASM domain
MRGSDFAISTLIKGVLFAAVLLIAFLLVSGYILPVQGGMGNIDAIQRLCPDWQKLYSCSCDMASSSDLSIKVGTETKTLADLCANHFGNEVNFDENICAKCKQFPLCGGCPATTG